MASSKVTNKVVTITLNPALDLTGQLGTLTKGTVNLVSSSSIHAAGKGVNVAKVLSDLGADVTVTGFLGKNNPELFQQLFHDINAKNEFIYVDGSTRINVKLVEDNGEVSDLNFPGVQVTSQDIANFEATLIRLAKEHDYFVFAGSLPKGITPSQSAKWIQLLHDLGKKVIFDSSREALAAGLESKPWLIKPNEEELGEFIGKKLTTPEDCQHAALELSDKGIDNIVISMGPQGVMWLNQGEWLQSQPPRMKVVSTVGAGDTLVAGLCWGHMQAMDKPSLLKQATALSALAVSQIGVGVANTNQLNDMIQQIQLQTLCSAQSK
ncbi:1-phosphofructokinase [Vibrio sp. 10N.286.49.B3]|uniref:1-phosphofructokinase n=1 Tax=Vibrio sp. 10N.286.49.B3 TaxID=1880855 RepID=UPI000C84EC4D|nr:1-phosphofructokinase [Vibrio sp. 10N.286.49.B3]PMH43769.1 1-phosphofructokinase [Vibrio sp. 10N.286.49.B3]